MTAPQTKVLPVEMAEAATLAPFGQMLGRGAGAAALPVDFYQGHVRMAHPVDFRCDHPVELTLASMTRRAPEVRYLERHFQHTQSFIPLGGKGFIAVMAPPSMSSLPDLDAVRAFRFDGSAGLTLHLGTWHEFPFCLEDESDVVVVLSRQTSYDLKVRDAETDEAHGPDLDKKDIVARANVLFRFDPAA